MAGIQGLLCGLGDPPITPLGKQQANTLMPAFYRDQKNFNAGIHCSDQIRCYKFTDVAQGFNARRLVKVDTRLREINFGDVCNFFNKYDSMKD